ncbi:MAG: hypothetical protein V4773_23320 [Verrucomicrobiota bacterium]
MARATPASHLYTIVQLERSAHVLSRMREELRSMPDSTRARWLLDRNEKAFNKATQKIETTREKLNAAGSSSVK